MAKRRKTPPYTQFTLKALKLLGFKGETVERYNSFAWRPDGRGVRQDFMGIIDIIVFQPGVGTWGVQSTSLKQFSSHNKKIKDPEHREDAFDWIKSGNELFLFAWGKALKKKGGKQEIWIPRIKRYTLEDFE